MFHPVHGNQEALLIEGRKHYREDRSAATALVNQFALMPAYAFLPYEAGFVSQDSLAPCCTSIDSRT